MKVYLDIDGVLLANDKQAALHADELVEYLVKNHDVHWLTTHCMDGDGAWACQLLSRYLKPETQLLLGQIQPTTWGARKTEAINFDEPFVWLDDDVFEDEIEILKHNNALEKWIPIDLADDPHQLRKVIDSLSTTRH